MGVGIKAQVRDLVVTPRLLVRWNNPPSLSETRTGAPSTRPEPQAKTGLFPPETGARFSGGGDTQDQRNNSKRFPRNPRASSGRRPTATLTTRDVPTRERRHPDRGARRGIGQFASATPPAAGRSGPCRRRGKGRRPRSLSDADHASKEAKRDSCRVPRGVASGERGRHQQFGPPCISSPWSRGRARDSAREP
jgi:hypothetical protein